MAKRVAVVAGLTLALSQTAFAGEPAWCKGEDFGASHFNYKAGRGDDGDLRTTVRNIVEYSCSKDAELDAKRPELDKLRAEVSKELFMNDADWTDAVAWVKESGFSNTEDSIKITEKTLASLMPMDQYVATRYGFTDEGGYGAGANGDWTYRADALEDVMTETGRLGVLEHCFNSRSVSRDDDSVVAWAICADDIQKFDGNKFATEVRGDGAHEPKQKTMLHIRLGVVMAGLKDAAAERDKLFKKDDAYKKVFAVAQKGREDWRKGVGTNKDLLALVQSMESARWFHSRKQFAGCEEKTQKALSDAASKVPAKLFKNMYDERDDPFHGFATKAAPILADQPEFNLAGTAYALCQPDTGIGSWLGGMLDMVPGYRGPRTAAFTAVFHQQFELDDTQAKAVPKPDIGSRPYSSKSTASSYGGGLKSFKAGTGDKKGKMVATLEKTMIKQEDCVKEHSSGRISAITSSGTVQYEMICDKSAIVEHDHTWEPFDISERTSKWVKPGQLFSAVGDNGKGEVFAVWSSKTAKQPSMLFGGAVK